MAKEFLIVIPARLESSRLEKKLLKEINGKTIIERTWKKCLESQAKEEQEERGYVEEGRKMLWSFILCVNLLFYDSSFMSNKIIFKLFDKSTICI